MSVATWHKIKLDLDLLWSSPLLQAHFSTLSLLLTWRLSEKGESMRGRKVWDKKQHRQNWVFPPDNLAPLTLMHSPSATRKSATSNFRSTICGFKLPSRASFSASASYATHERGRERGVIDGGRWRGMPFENFSFSWVKYLLKIAPQDASLDKECSSLIGGEIQALKTISIQHSFVVCVDDTSWKYFVMCQPLALLSNSCKTLDFEEWHKGATKSDCFSELYHFQFMKLTFQPPKCLSDSSSEWSSGRSNTNWTPCINSSTNSKSSLFNLEVGYIKFFPSKVP